jgi:hypothetical protein
MSTWTHNNVLRKNRILFQGPITSYQIDMKLDKITGARPDKGSYTTIDKLLKKDTTLPQSLGAQGGSNKYRGAKY